MLGVLLGLWTNKPVFPSICPSTLGVLLGLFYFAVDISHFIISACGIILFVKQNIGG